jgi:hypothetical protein
LRRRSPKCCDEAGLEDQDGSPAALPVRPVLRRLSVRPSAENERSGEVRSLDLEADAETRSRAWSALAAIEAHPKLYH